MTAKRTALIDGDILCYECGFASDAGAKASGLVSEPVGFAIKGVREKIKSILTIVGADDYAIFLTAPGESYRSEVDPNYKMNRSADKPTHYHAIRGFLLSIGAEESKDGLEADDMLGIAQDKVGNTTVICSKDKDLDLIPGLHYNWSKTKKDKGVYMIGELDSRRAFYQMMLTGDSVDNIPGMYKILNKKCTAKWTDALETMADEVEFYSYVREVYMTLATENKKSGTGFMAYGADLTTERGVDSFLFIVGQLLHIQRFPGDFWKPPFGTFAGGKSAETKEVSVEDTVFVSGGGILR